MSRRRTTIIIGAVALGVTGVAIGIVAASGGGPNSGGMMGPESGGSSMSSYYDSMIGNHGGGSMMGGSRGSTKADPSLSWMMGGTTAPGWMDGGSLPAAMMGTSKDAGAVMGRLFADAPGDRVSASAAAQLGNARPADAIVDAKDHRITFSGKMVHLTALANPAGGPNDTFRIAGLVDPTIAVRAGSRVSIEVVNADTDAANGLAVVAEGSAAASMPMQTAAPSFGGSALWFLGNPTFAGMHAGTLAFTAGRAGSYQYLCPVPGHAKGGMVGAFVVMAS
jgi:plastocyanin